MTDRVRTVDMSDPAVVLDCYRKLNIAYKELKAENERLQKYYEELIETNAKLIVHVRMENDKLRTALKPFADKEYAYEGWAETARDAVWFNISDLRAAAAALKETGDE